MLLLKISAMLLAALASGLLIYSWVDSHDRALRSEAKAEAAQQAIQTLQQDKVSLQAEMAARDQKAAQDAASLQRQIDSIRTQADALAAINAQGGPFQTPLASSNPKLPNAPVPLTSQQTIDLAHYRLACDGLQSSLGTCRQDLADQKTLELKTESQLAAAQKEAADLRKNPQGGFWKRLGAGIKHAACGAGGAGIGMAAGRGGKAGTGAIVGAAAFGVCELVAR